MHFDEFVIGDAMVNAINCYRVHWNCNMGVDINYRNFETMGCKTPLLTNFHPAYESLGMVHKSNCLVYSNVEEMIELTDLALKDDSFRLQLAENGYQLVKKLHTYKHRAKNLLESLDANK